MDIKSIGGFCGTIFLSIGTSLTRNDILFLVTVLVGLSTVAYNAISIYIKIKNKGK